MLTFLKRAAQIIIEAGGIVAGIGPAVQPFVAALDPKAAPVVATVTDRFQSLVDAVMQAEVFGQSLGLPGTDKAKAAAGPIAQILMDYMTVRGYKLADDQKAKLYATAQAIGGNIADFLNTIHPDSVTVTPPPTA